MLCHVNGPCNRESLSSVLNLFKRFQRPREALGTASQILELPVILISISEWPTHLSKSGSLLRRFRFYVWICKETRPTA